MEVDGAALAGPATASTLSFPAEAPPFPAVMTPTRPLSAVSGTDNLLSLFDLEHVYATHVRPYEGPIEVEGEVKLNGAAEGKGGKQKNGYAYMLDSVSGSHDFRKDQYFVSLINNPDDSMPPGGLRKLDAATLRDCFALDPGQLENFDQQEWYRTDAHTHVKRSRKLKRKADGSATQTPAVASGGSTPSVPPPKKRKPDN